MRSTKIAQLAVCLAMYSNALAFTIIFPFGSLMVQDFGLATDRSTTGYWVGVLGFALMGSRVVSSPLWGSFCDRYGRRPAALFGALAVTVFSLTFGMSQNYWMAVTSRALLGGLCCSSLVGKAIINELTHGDPVAMGWVMMSWQVGNISGDILGGLLVDPVGSGLVSSDFLEEYPYLLPNLVVAICGFVSLLLSLCFLPETLVKKEAHETHTVRSYRELLADRQVLMITLVYVFVSFTNSGFYELITLWCWADKENGGFAMTPSQIGSTLGISAIILLTVEGLIYKLLLRWMNVVAILRSATLAAGAVLMCLPLLTFLNETEIAKEIGIGIGCFCWWLISFFSLSNIMVMQNNCVINQERGRMGGISMTSNSIAKALSPVVVGSVFASTAKSGLPYPLNFAFTFVLMAGVMVVIYFICQSSQLDSLQKPKETLSEPLIQKGSK